MIPLVWLKLFSLSLVNMFTYPLVVFISAGFFLAGKITWFDFLGKCGYVPRYNFLGKEFIWFHVSSAGEWTTGKIFAKNLKEKANNPLLITYFNGDLTKQIEKEKEKGFLTPDCLAIFLPVENTFSLWTIHHHYQIRAVVILETEIWPSLILVSHWLKKKIFLVNAVLFEQETRKLLWFKPIFSWILNKFYHISCISEKSQNNFIRLGVSKKKLAIRPNFKYDLFDRVINLKIKDANFSKDNEKWRELKDFFSKQIKLKRKIVILASFHYRECALVIPAIRDLFIDKDYCMIIAPRETRPPAIEALERFLIKSEISYIKRSDLQDKNISKQGEHNLILDSFGELSSVYSLVNLVVMGGTFIPIGGHNFLEAIFFNKMVFLGRYLHHYDDFVDNFKDYIRKSEIMELSQNIKVFFDKKEYSQVKGGVERIEKFSGSSKLTSNRIARELISTLKNEENAL